MPVDICSPKIGPYGGVVLDKQRMVGGRTYRLLLYRSYDAGGLIGSEFNGIAVLDDDAKQIVTDNIEKIESGYSVPTRGQIAMLEHMLRCTPEQFKEICNNSSRSRGEI